MLSISPPTPRSSPRFHVRDAPHLIIPYRPTRIRPLLRILSASALGVSFHDHNFVALFQLPSSRAEFDPRSFATGPGIHFGCPDLPDYLGVRLPLLS